MAESNLSQKLMRIFWAETFWNEVEKLPSRDLDLQHLVIDPNGNVERFRYRDQAEGEEACRVMEIPTLQTKRLLLRPFRGSDLDAYAAMRSDAEILRYLAGA